MWQLFFLVTKVLLWRHTLKQQELTFISSGGQINTIFFIKKKMLLSYELFRRMFCRGWTYLELSLWVSGVAVLLWFQMSIKLHCFFNLGLKRRVWNALSTTLGRWIGFLWSRSRLLVDPLWFFFFLTLSLAQSRSALWLESPATRGTRKTQLEWRSCSAELEATVGREGQTEECEMRLKAVCGFSQDPKRLWL